jgi:hypothetical protein
MGVDADLTSRTRRVNTFAIDQIRSRLTHTRTGTIPNLARKTLLPTFPVGTSKFVLCTLCWPMIRGFIVAVLIMRVFVVMGRSTKSEYECKEPVSHDGVEIGTQIFLQFVGFKNKSLGIEPS